MSTIDDYPDNDARAGWAVKALEAFGEQTNQVDYDLADRESLDEIAGDLISCIGHLCDKANAPFGDVIRSGVRHWAYERTVEAKDETDHDYVCDPDGDEAATDANSKILL